MTESTFGVTLVCANAGRVVLTCNTEVARRVRFFTQTWHCPHAAWNFALFRTPRIFPYQIKKNTLQQFLLPQSFVNLYQLFRKKVVQHLKFTVLYLLSQKVVLIFFWTGVNLHEILKSCEKKLRKPVGFAWSPRCWKLDCSRKFAAGKTCFSWEISGKPRTGLGGDLGVSSRFDDSVCSRPRRFKVWDFFEIWARTSSSLFTEEKKYRALCPCDTKKWDLGILGSRSLFGISRLCSKLCVPTFTHWSGPAWRVKPDTEAEAECPVSSETENIMTRLTRCRRMLGAHIRTCECAQIIRDFVKNNQHKSKFWYSEHAKMCKDLVHDRSTHVNFSPDVNRKNWNCRRRNHAIFTEVQKGGKNNMAASYLSLGSESETFTSARRDFCFSAAKWAIWQSALDNRNKNGTRKIVCSSKCFDHVMIGSGFAGSP